MSAGIVDQRQHGLTHPQYVDPGAKIREVELQRDAGGLQLVPQHVRQFRQMRLQPFVGELQVQCPLSARVTVRRSSTSRASVLT